jgi:hypothetical protein
MDTRKLIERLEKIKVVDIKEAIEITEKQRAVKLKDGFDFDYASGTGMLTVADAGSADLTASDVIVIMGSWVD